MLGMKILKEITSQTHFSAYFEDNGEIFAADLILIVLGGLAFTKCMIFKAHKTNRTESGYAATNLNELYSAKDIPFTRDSLLACIKEFCRVTDGD